jgi:catechol 2,3-dioxygenase-like lactoylglutathione lyase family enzyme
MSKADVFIDHLTLSVRDLEASRSFYRQALAPFGVEEVEAEGGRRLPRRPLTPAERTTGGPAYDRATTRTITART